MHSSRFVLRSVLRARPAAIVLAAATAGATAALAASCSPDQESVAQTATAGGGSSSEGGGGSGGATAAGGSGGSDLLLDASVTDAELQADSACAQSSAEATLTKKPVDIIIVIDNSGSMGDNIKSVQANINDNFAAIIGASGIDYRVILISEHGEADGPESVCIKEPLSKTSCEPVPPQPANNPPVFFHYSISISSHDALCRLLDSFDGSVKDQFNLAPKGWSEWSRPDAFKIILVLTDDGVQCTSTTPAANLDDNDSPAGGDTIAKGFEKALFSLGGGQFGDEVNRNYLLHGIIGIQDNNPPTAAWQPGDPMVTGVCETAVAPGTGYQSLAKSTGGLRFPICQFKSYDVVFQEMAKGIVSGVKLECEFPMPEPPEGETIDLKTVVVEYTPSDGGESTKFKQVEGPEKCAEGTFYIEDDIIKLCPASCKVVQDDPLAKIAILFGCKVESF